MLQEMGIVLFTRAHSLREQAPLTHSSSARAPGPSETVSARKVAHTNVPASGKAPLASFAPPFAPALTNKPLPKTFPDLAGLSWSELNACVASCEQCPLGLQAPAKHFGSSALNPEVELSNDPPQDVSWLVVSDAPKLGLDQKAQVFNAASFPLFQQFFKALGSNSAAAHPNAQQIYLTTALKCVPLKHEDALTQESLVCLNHLREQVRRLKPKVIVVMGRVAAHLLLAGTPMEQQPLGRLRSQVLSFEGTPMVVTYSPEFLLHAQADKALCWEDLCLAQSIEAQAT